MSCPFHKVLQLSMGNCCIQHDIAGMVGLYGDKKVHRIFLEVLDDLKICLSLGPATYVTVIRTKSLQSSINCTVFGVKNCADYTRCNESARVIVMCLADLIQIWIELEVRSPEGT